MNGVLYAVGVGPGDPELLSLKAVRILDQADVIACPAKDGAPGLAFQIAARACPAIETKESLPLTFPMRDGEQTAAHREAAARIISVLRTGKSVAFLTLGDPGFYSTFSHVAEAVKEEGFDIEIISGVPSFAAVLAALRFPAAVGKEPVLITAGEFRDFDGTLIILKAGVGLKALKDAVAAAGRSACLVENYALPGQHIYPDLPSMPDMAGYFSILVVRPAPK